MRWYYEKRLVDAALRETFEQHGVATMQHLLAAPDRPFYHGAERIDANRVRSDLLAWLREQAERAEVVETWSLMMEVAITVLVLAELALMIFRKGS